MGGAAGQRWSVFRENTKDTKNHEGTRRKTASVGNRRLRRTQRPQRRQRGTETGGVLAHADCQCVFKSQRTRRTQRGGAGGRAVRAHKAHVRPEGPVGAWRASHAMLWGRGADAPTAWARCVQEMQEIQEIQERPYGATGEALYKAASAAVLVSYRSSISYLFAFPRRRHCARSQMG